MKKILFISHEAYRTGAPLVLLSLLRELKKREPDSELYVLQLKDGPIEDEFQSVANTYICKFDHNDGWKRFIPYKIRKRINQWEYRRWLKRPQFDLIYANTIASVEKAVELKKILNIPILAHIHEMEYTFKQYKIRREILQQCDTFIAVSTPVVNTLMDYGIDEKRITLIQPFSTNLELTNHVDRSFKIAGVEEGDFVIGLSGQGGWRKGTDLLPMLVKKFVTQYPDVSCKFVWVGYTDKYAINYEAKLLGVEKYIIQTGVVPNPMDYYNQFDVFVLLSREDPFPLVCMECAALAKPIILFENASGIVDLVKHEESGLLVPYLDLEAVVDAICTLQNKPDLRKQYGKALRDKLNMSFGIQKSLNSLINHLDKIETV